MFTQQAPPEAGPLSLLSAHCSPGPPAWRPHTVCLLTPLAALEAMRTGSAEVSRPPTPAALRGLATNIPLQGCGPPAKATHSCLPGLSCPCALAQTFKRTSTLQVLSAQPKLEHQNSPSLFFLGRHPWHMEGPRLGVESQLQLPAYTTATATPDP